MNTGKMVYWSDGLFLKPHHFQFIDKSIKDNFSFFIDKIYPNKYGFMNYKFNLESLKNGVLALESCDFFINETAINYPLNSNIITRHIKSDIKHGESKKFYLGIKKINKDNVNIEVSNIKDLINTNTRYSNIESEFEEVSNIYNTQDKADLSYVKYTLHFFLEYEVASLVDYDLISLCKIHNNNDEFSFENDFIPPLLSIPSRHNLFEKIDSTFKLIVQSMQTLEKDKLKSQNLIILSCMNPMIIDIQTLLSKSNIPPYSIYNLFEKTISILIVFTKSYNMELFVNTKNNTLKYNHEDIYKSFSLLHKELQNIFDEIIEEKVEIQREFIFNCERNDDKYFINIENKFFDKKYSFYLEFINDDKDKLIEHINYLKISNSEFIDTIIFSSISDVGFKLQTKSDLTFPTQPNSVYIKLDTHSKNWDKIIESKNLAIYIDQNLIKETNLVLLDISDE